MKNYVKDPNDSNVKVPATWSKTSIDFQVTKTFTVLLLILISTSMTSCELIGGVFKAGMGVGIFIVIAIIAVIVAFAMRAGKK